MKNTCAMLLLFVLSFAMIGQEKEVEIVEEEIEILNLDAVEHEFYMDVDSSVFTKTYGNRHFSEDGKALLTINLRNYPYQAFKDHLNDKIGGFTLIEAKEITLKGESYLYSHSEQDRAGTIFSLISYIKKCSDDSVLSIGGYYVKGAGETYADLMQQAAISSRLINTK